jgi:hypothetical protein
MGKPKINKPKRLAASKVAFMMFHFLISVIGRTAYGLQSDFVDELGRGLTDREKKLVKKHFQVLRDEAEWWRRFGRYLDGRR